MNLAINFGFNDLKCMLVIMLQATILPYPILVCANDINAEKGVYITYDFGKGKIRSIENCPYISLIHYIF